MECTPEMKDKFRERLKRIVGKKFDTTMIFPLSQFEMAFGELFGINQPEENLTPQQRTYRAKWEECRNNILNNGNHQKRNAFAEIDMHDVVWNRYSTTLLPIQEFMKRNSKEN